MPTPNNHGFGMALTDGTQFWVFYLAAVGGLEEPTVQEWSTTASAGGVSYQAAWGFPGPVTFFRIYNDGTNYHFCVSGEGINYSTIYSTGITSFLTATKVGMMGFNENGTLDTVVANVWGWENVVGSGASLAW